MVRNLKNLLKNYLKYQDSKKRNNVLDFHLGSGSSIAVAHKLDVT
jgi:adenine specific DNA methylase Mod